MPIEVSVNASVVPILVTLSLFPCQLSCSVGDDAASNEEPAPAAQHDGDDASNGEPSEVGQANACLTARGTACRAACWGAATLGCGVVGAACTGTAVITIGGTSIPCVWAVVAACTANTVGASICSDLCPP